ncbi:MAG: GntR family transcriptional regulator, partial [Terriglobia bacterium]
MDGSILRDGLYVRLRERIISGQLPPGAPLVEERLAAELNVSRTPLRETLRQLSEQGFVEYTPHKGSRVVALTPELVREVLLIREALEGVAAREAAVFIDGERLTVVRARFEHLRTLISQGDV